MNLMHNHPHRTQPFDYVEWMHAVKRSFQIVFRSFIFYVTAVTRKTIILQAISKLFLPNTLRNSREFETLVKMRH